MLETLRRRGWDLPRVRSYERVGVGTLAVILTTILLGAIRDPNLLVFGVCVVLLVTGVFIGLIVERKRDAFVSGFVIGFAGLLIGYSLLVPVFYVLTQTVSGLGLLLAVLAGFAFGFGFGLVAGVVCGVASVLASVFSKARSENMNQDGVKP